VLTEPPSATERIAGAVSRGAKAIPGAVADYVSSLPEQFKENTPGFQQDMLPSPEQREAIESARNLAAAEAEDRRQVAEMHAAQKRAAPREFAKPFSEDELAGMSPSAQRIARGFPKVGLDQPRQVQANDRLDLENQMDSGPPPAFASGGKVTPEAHMRAVRTTLSAMQHELQRALSGAMKQLEGLGGRKNAQNQTARVKAHHDGLIEDIWALHELSKKIMEGKLQVHPRISKEELIDMARHGSRTSNTQAA
jgi:hypothetical protein